MVGVNRTRYSTTLIGKDKWYFLVFKFNGDEPYLYINGVMEGTLGGSKATYLQQSSTGLNLIGKKGDSATVFFNGAIDDVRIYDAALPSFRIKQNYIAGLNSMLAHGNMSKKEYNQKIEVLSFSTK